MTGMGEPLCFGKPPSAAATTLSQCVVGGSHHVGCNQDRVLG